MSAAAEEDQHIVLAVPVVVAAEWAAAMSGPGSAGQVVAGTQVAQRTPQDRAAQGPGVQDLEFMVGMGAGIIRTAMATDITTAVVEA